jgi:integrase
MTPEVFECLQELRKQRDRPHDDLVFVNRYHRPWKDWRTAFQNARKKAGLSDVHFHDLRHTFASLLAMSNVNSKALSEFLGHRDLTMTARYSHLSDGYTREAVSLLPGYGPKQPKASPFKIPCGRHGRKSKLA